MKLDQESLSKHRFWILFGVMVPLLLVCMLWLTTSVADTNQDKRIMLTKHKDQLEQKSKADLKGNEYLKLLTGRASKLEDQRLQLWDQAYTMQKDLLVWPKDLQESIGKLTFGDPISENELGKFARKDYYQAEVDQLGDTFKASVPLGADAVTVESVRFKDGHDKVLSHVKQWKAPSPDEVWLAQEDLWIQRELLKAIQDANNFVARFQKVDKDSQGKAYPSELGPNDRYRAHFINPYWHLDLILAEKAAGFTLRGTIQNRPDSRRQLPISRIYFAVQLNKDGKPVTLPVEGEALAPGQEWPIKEFPLAGLVNPEGLLGVTQIFETRDAPVRQINEIALAHASHRGASKPLLPMPRAAAPAATPPKGATPTLDPRKKSEDAPTQTKTENGLWRERYTEVSKEVRRMPFGLVLLVDQAHVPEVLTALANCRLRVQVTQVGWQHYRGPLAVDAARPAVGPAGGRPVGKGPATVDMPQTNVVELAVYGIASVYERYEPKEAAPKDAAPVIPPAKVEVKEKKE